MGIENKLSEAGALEGAAKMTARRLDWERIERDHSTGRYTDEELASLHKTNRTTISLKRKKDRAKHPGAWAVDRTQAVKRATAALVMQASANETISAGNDAAAIMGIAAASRDVILSHRADVKAGRRVAAILMAELEGITEHRDSLDKLVERACSTLDEAEAASLTAQVRELAKLSTRIGGVQKLADAMARLQTLERKAFGIGDDDTGSNPLDTMNEAELQAEVDRLTQALGGAAG